MELRLGNLKPNEALIYERSEGVVYARYRDPPFNKIPRWVVGEDSKAVLGYGDWQEIRKLAETHPTLKKQLDQLLNTYYLLKDNK